MRRCLLVVDAPDGGVVEHVMRLAGGLRDRGWDPWLVGPESSSIYGAVKSIAVPIARVPFRPGYRHVRHDLAALRHLIALMRHHRFDLVNTHSPKAGALGRLAAIAVGIPVVCTAPGFAFDPRGRGFPGRAVSLSIERLLAPRTDAIICVSDDVVRVALEHRVASRSRLRMVHNGAPGCDLTLEPDAELERFSRQGLLVGCMCVLTPRKGVAVFLEAARQVLDSLPESRFAVIGNGVSSEELKRYSHTLGLDEQLRFFDYRHPSARQLRSLDVFVLPSLWEALPIGPLEAMACGVPQVATNVGGTAEAVRDGETGLLCPPGDSTALAERIIRLLRDPDLRSRMSQASRERHRRFFTLERMLDETAAVFDEVIARRERASADHW